MLVRAAPSPSFPVPNGALLPLVVAALGPRAAPSLASLLPLREAAERMQAGCPLPPLAFSSQASPFSSLSSLFSSPSLYSSPSPRTAAAASVVSDGTAGGRQEWYYIQSPVPREWLGEGAGSEGGADSSPLSALLLPGGAASPPAPSRRTVTQDYRLWLSPPNAVSPLHWDVSRSALAVLRGAKTFHFWTPQDTFGALGPRSEWGLLRRRCAAEPAAAAAGAGRRRCPPAALRAVVRAGDAVAFPPFWAHHVLSHGEEGAEGAEGAEEGGEGPGRGSVVAVEESPLPLRPFALLACCHLLDPGVDLKITVASLAPVFCVCAEREGKKGQGQERRQERKKRQERRGEEKKNSLLPLPSSSSCRPKPHP